MKSILFVVTKSDVGGAQKWVKEQVDICNSHFLCYVATNRDGWLTRCVDTNKIYCDTLIENRMSLTYLKRLNSYIRDNRIDIVVANSANAGIYTRILKILNPGTKVIFVSHGWSAIYNGNKLRWIYIQVEKFLSYFSDSILCISEFDYSNAKKVIGISKKKLKKITNSIIPLENKISTLNGKIKILTVMRISAPKRLDLLVSAVKDVEVELHVFGEGDLRGSIEEISPNNVFFHGEVEAFNEFNDYDVFCLISDSEGLPLSALEAMSCGMPLILSKVGGCVELIDGNGWLVENHVESIKNVIINNIDNFAAKGRGSEYLFEKKFNLLKNRLKYIDYYNNI